MTIDNQNKLITFIMGEMKKVIKDAQSGKTPQMSPSLEKLASELQKVQTKQMSEEEVKSWVKTVSSDVLKIDEEK